MVFGVTMRQAIIEQVNVYYGFLVFLAVSAYVQKVIIPRSLVWRFRQHKFIKESLQRFADDKNSTLHKIPCDQDDDVMFAYGLTMPGSEDEIQVCRVFSDSKMI